MDAKAMQKYSQYHEISTEVHGFTYSRIRVFWRPHQHGDLLAKDPILPMLVFVHGNGGSIPMFSRLISSFNFAACLAIDLPGCGKSAFEPEDWKAYTTEALAELLATVIEKYRDKEKNQGIVFIGHDIGSAIAVLLASASSSLPFRLSDYTWGLLAACPPMNDFSRTHVLKLKALTTLPTPIVDKWRRHSVRGDGSSASVAVSAGSAASSQIREFLATFKRQGRTEVWLRYLAGGLPHIDGRRLATNGLPGGAVWGGLDTAVYLVAGQDDKITTPAEMEQIAEAIRQTERPRTGFEVFPRASLPRPKRPSSIADDTVVRTPGESAPPVPTIDPQEPSASTSPSQGVNKDISRVTTFTAAVNQKQEGLSKPRKILMTTVMASPAAHAIHFDERSRSLAALYSRFMEFHISPMLSSALQLQLLTHHRKLDMKNLAKWKSVTAVSGCVDDIFRAMKMLRQADWDHNPAAFVAEWGDRIQHVIDLTKEEPMYDTTQLEDGGILYHKIPTDSRVPPKQREVNCFINIVDDILEDEARASRSRNGKQKATDFAGRHVRFETCIAVHCHYGFNRTGFMIICYLIARRGYDLQYAVEEFARIRPPGIKHENLIHELYVRYFTEAVN
ncbi:MAG: hypothetical protein M1825_001186 [Sarcosagium campestre]|nr:MAG: hypothetical protein M1825_001186 [Sarcosagium campestre]